MQLKFYALLEYWWLSTSTVLVLEQNLFIENLVEFVQIWNNSDSRLVNGLNIYNVLQDVV